MMMYVSGMGHLDKEKKLLLGNSGQALVSYISTSALFLKYDSTSGSDTK
jgi:hypothetical protein